ncbi:MAG TPA: SDR family oxidoreductase [Acidimicrobiales bacterium]|jgi:NAD(P)-dependent dehydrogenase (short-subunit alcohol dehydrogenase family)|nr:SDR family oxidoreductase [Acidimicrobiales bacterium]
MARPAAIVTGSDSGIGKATAVAFAEAGYDVGITWHTDEEGARRTAAEAEAAGAATVVRRLDLGTDVGSAAPLVEEMVSELGQVDAFVNNAGTGTSTPFLDMALPDWRHVLEVDLTGPFVCGQAAAKLMRESGGGVIVNVTSVHEHVPLRGSAPYCAAKGGLGLLTKVMALELAEHGIRVVSVAPGEIATPMTGQEEEDPHGKERPGIPMNRPGDAREIASMIRWLASDEATYVTGTSFVVDGGMLLMAAVANQQRS